jgi:hypothetical protein
VETIATFGGLGIQVATPHAKPKRNERAFATAISARHRPFVRPFVGRSSWPNDYCCPCWRRDHAAVDRVADFPNQELRADIPVERIKFPPRGIGLRR